MNPQSLLRRALIAACCATVLVGATLAQAQPVDPAQPTDPPAEPAQPEAVQGQGKTKAAKADKAPVKISGVVQLRYAVGPNWRGGHPDAVTGPLATAWTNSFTVPRARLEAGTRILDWKVRTKVDFGRGVVRLLNAYGERELGWGTELKLGQFKRIFSQTYLISSEEMQLFERPDAPEEAGGARDIGALLSGVWLDERVMAGVGVYNGNGLNTSGNDNTNLRVEARLDVAPLGRYQLDSHPIGRKLKVRLGGGVAQYTDNDTLKSQIAGKQVLVKQYDESLAWSGFAAVRALGVEVRAEGFQGVREPVDARDSDARTVSLESLGVHATDWRGGYVQLAADMPFHRPLQLAGAAETWEPDADVRAGSDTRYTAALNYYLQGDDAKIQAAWQYRQLRKAGEDDYTRWTAFLQLQLAY